MDNCDKKIAGLIFMGNMPVTSIRPKEYNDKVKEIQNNILVKK